jgi:hypothetical protein
MISSAEEFKRLRESEIEAEYHRAAHEEANETVWRDVIGKFPEMKKWVICNKTVPLSILKLLAKDKDADVRTEVARKRKLSRELFILLSQDQDVGVLHTLALNKKIPSDIFDTLSANTKDEWLLEKLREIESRCFR